MLMIVIYLMFKGDKGERRRTRKERSDGKERKMKWEPVREE